MRKPTDKQIGAFVNSMRGRYIISQALFLAAKLLKEVEEPFRESSNIADMEFLIDNAFPLFKELHAARERHVMALRKRNKKKTTESPPDESK